MHTVRKPRRAYWICFTPRTGSALLCQLLRATGVAGRPEEYFWRDNEPLYRTLWHVTSYHNYLERARYTHLLDETLPAHATVLELGCGAGLPTTRILAQRFHVIGVDIAAQQLARARRHVPTATFIHADMTRLVFTRACFDAVVAFYSLIHVPRQEYAALFRVIASWIRPGGWFMATLGLGDLDAGLEANWLGMPMYWSSFDRAISLHLLREAGFIIQYACEETADEDGVAVTFLWFLGRREA